MKKLLKKLICAATAATLALSVGVGILACGDTNDNGEGGGNNTEQGGNQGNTGNEGNQGGNQGNTGNEGNQGGNQGSAAKEYKLEAENIDLSWVNGGDTSASPSGDSLILEAPAASGGKLIRALYVNGCMIEFEFTSDKAVTDAKLVFAFAGEYNDFPVYNDEFKIFLNPETIEDNQGYRVKDESKYIKYDEIALKADSVPRDYTIATGATLIEGTNRVICLVSNTTMINPDWSYSTMNARAPMVDCLKITTTATITHKKY